MRVSAKNELLTPPSTSTDVSVPVADRMLSVSVRLSLVSPLMTAGSLVPVIVTLMFLMSKPPLTSSTRTIIGTSKVVPASRWS